MEPGTDAVSVDLNCMETLFIGYEKGVGHA